jgi:hypothetical protein
LKEKKYREKESKKEKEKTFNHPVSALINPFW